MIRWRPELELGVRVLDTHHRRLVALTLEVYEKARGGASQAEVLKRLRALIDFAAWHFGFEESVMAETGFREKAAHGEQHGELLGQLQRFAGRVETGAAGPLHSARTFAFLDAWVMRHILLTDRCLAEYLVDRGWNLVSEIHT